MVVRKATKKELRSISATRPIRVLIVSEDLPTYSEGLRLILDNERDFEVVGIANNGQEALNKAKELLPDILLMGIDVPGLDGVEITRRIRSSKLHIRILILTSCSDERPLLAAMEAGADGCLSMKASSDQLIDSLKAIHYGQILFESRVAPTILKYIRDAAKIASQQNTSPGLSKRQIEILKLAAKGMTNKEIGASLYLSERTVQAHLASIFGKLGATSRTEAVALAIDRGWIT